MVSVMTVTTSSREISRLGREGRMVMGPLVMSQKWNVTGGRMNIRY